MTTERIDIVISERGARRVRRKIEKIGTAATASGGAVKLLRRALGLLGGALILGTVISTLADFSQAMSTVKAISEATDQQFKELRDTAKDLGATTRFSATQAAEGMLFLSRAGFEANEVIAAIGPTLRLAQAGALDLGRAADIASNILKGFRLEAGDTQRVVDVLAKSANSANTNVEQLGSAMSFVAPAAAALGINIETTASAIGVLSDAGIQATRAGTGLRQIFVKLLDPTGRAKATIKDLGLTLADLNIEARGLAPVLETLKQKNIGLFEASRLVGVRQATALLVLVESTKKLKELSKANDEAAGTAKRVADIMDDNLRGALFAVKSAFEAVILAAGDLGVDSFLTASFRNLAAALRFVAKNIDDVAVAVGVMAAAFVAMRLPVIIGLFKSLAFVLLANPFIALATAITATAAALTVFRDEIKLTKDGTVTLGDAMSGLGDIIGGRLTQAVNAIGGDFVDFGAIAQFAIEDISKSVIFLAAATNGTVEVMIGAFQGLPRAMKRVASIAFNGFLEIMEASLNIFVRDIKKALSFLGISVDAIELFDFERFKVEGTAAGETVGTAFMRGFNAVIEATEAGGKARRAKALLEAAGLSGDGKTPVGGAKRPGGRDIGGGLTADEKDFNKILDALLNENELLQLNTELRAIRAGELEAEDELGRRLTETEKARLGIARQVNLQLQVEREVLDEVRGPLETYGKKLKAINSLLAQNKISQEEAADAARDLRIAFLETSKSLEDGFERALLKIGKKIEDFSALSEKLMVDAFEGAEDALVEFVKTGKISFTDLANSIIADLARMAIRASITKPLFDIFRGIFSPVLSDPGVPSVGPSGRAGGLIQAAAGATGGLLQGGGTGTSDNIPVKLSNGEFVTNAASTSRFLPLLEAINGFTGSGSPRGGGGGVVVQVIDQRGTGAPPVEREERTGGDGLRTITLIIKDVISREISSGGLDRPFQGRFGVTPALRG